MENRAYALAAGLFTLLLGIGVVIAAFFLGAMLLKPAIICWCRIIRCRG